MAQAMVEATLETAILYADESRIQLLPLLRSMWCWVGAANAYTYPGSNMPRMIFGALDIRSGR